jgi:hypothetical protein
LGGRRAPDFVPSSARADPGCRREIIFRIRHEGLTYILHDCYSDGAFCRSKVLLKNPLLFSRISFSTTASVVRLPKCVKVSAHSLGHFGN